MLGSCSGFVRSFHSAGRVSDFCDVKSTKMHLETGPLGANDDICWTKSFLAALLISLPLLSRRSNSISKSPGPSSPKEPLLLSRDISRSESLRSSSSCSQQIFRPCDLIHGEVLGKGFFGQAIKVRDLPKHSSVTLSTAVYLVNLDSVAFLCPADSDQSWNSPGLLSEIHFSVSLSLSNVNLAYTGSSPELECPCHCRHLGEVGRVGKCIKSPVQYCSSTISVAYWRVCQADSASLELWSEPKCGGSHQLLHGCHS